MSENWKIQVSPKLADGTLINLRAETPEEAEKVLAWATANASLVTDTVKAFVGTAVVTQSFPGAQVVEQNGPSWSQGGSQQDGGASNYATNSGAPTQQGEGKTCIHGPMTYREGVGKQSNKPYKAYFCSAPKGSAQCAPEFLR
jgi:hypothetical protein